MCGSVEAEHKTVQMQKLQEHKARTACINFRKEFMQAVLYDTGICSLF